MSQFSFSSSVRSSMIIELVSMIPRSTGLDYKIGAPGPPETEAPAAKTCVGAAAVGQAHGLSPPARRSETQIRGCSSVGRAPDLHSGGRRFDPDQLHQLRLGPVAQLARAHP